MCHYMLQNGSCPYGEHCAFAHDAAERRKYRNAAVPTIPKRVPQPGQSDEARRPLLVYRDPVVVATRARAALVQLWRQAKRTTWLRPASRRRSSCVKFYRAPTNDPYSHVKELKYIPYVSEDDYPLCVVCDQTSAHR